MCALILSPLLGVGCQPLLEDLLEQSKPAKNKIFSPSNHTKITLAYFIEAARSLFSFKTFYFCMKYTNKTPANIVDSNVLSLLEMYLLKLFLK